MIGLDNSSAPNRRQAIIWTNADPIHYRIYATLGGDELTWSIPDRVLDKQSHPYLCGMLSFINA